MHVFRDLTRLEVPPPRLPEIAYNWCSAIYENRGKFGAWEYLLLICLKAGFRRLDPWQPPTNILLTHTEHHQGLVDVVFKNPKDKWIVDLLHTRTLGPHLPWTKNPLDYRLIEHLTEFHTQFSSRLRRVAMRFVERVGYKGFEHVGVKSFVELLDRLGVEVENMDEKHIWMSLLFDVIRSPEGAQLLSDRYWELLVELVISEQLPPEFGDTDALKIAALLTDAQEWGKLECWIGIVWMCSDSQDVFNVILEDLEDSVQLLFLHRPDAAQMLEQRMEKWSQRHSTYIPESVQRLFTWPAKTAQRQYLP